jgi:hypothetical protein
MRRELTERTLRVLKLATIKLWQQTRHQLSRGAIALGYKAVQLLKPLRRVLQLHPAAAFIDGA